MRQIVYPCPVCASTMHPNSDTDNYRFNCPNCGAYKLTREAAVNMKSKPLSKQDAAKLSHAIRKMQGESGWVTVNSGMVDNICKNNVVPSHKEQVYNLLLWLGYHISKTGERARVTSNTHQAVIGAQSSEEVRSVLDSLEERNYARVNRSKQIGKGVSATVNLTFDGWEKRDEILKGRSDSRTAFMAMKFGSEELETVYNAFKVVVRRTGFELTKLDDKPKAGLIDNRLKVEILKARFLIADLTYGNHGAYWEAGFADGLGKPVFYTCEKDYFNKKKTHFDTNHYYTIKWDSKNIQDACNELVTAIRETLPDEALLEDESDA